MYYGRLRNPRHFHQNVPPGHRSRIVERNVSPVMKMRNEVSPDGEPCAVAKCGLRPASGSQPAAAWQLVGSGEVAFSQQQQRTTPAGGLPASDSSSNDLCVRQCDIDEELHRWQPRFLSLSTSRSSGAVAALGSDVDGPLEYPGCSCAVSAGISAVGVVCNSSSSSFFCGVKILSSTVTFADSRIVFVLLLIISRVIGEDGGGSDLRMLGCWMRGVGAEGGKGGVGRGDDVTFSDWLAQCLTTGALGMKLKIIAICWSVWKWRNDVIWNNKTWQTTNVLMEVQRLMDAWEEVLIQMPITINNTVPLQNGDAWPEVNIPKLEHFEGLGFRRWQKKMKFLLAALNVAYVLSTPKPVEQENETLDATHHRLKWKNYDLACRGHILNGMSDTLFGIYQYEESSKDLWDVLEAKYISEDASSKKFLVSEFNEFKMVDNRPVMEQFHEIVRILGQIRQHGMNMDDSIAIASIIDKLPPSWKKVHRTLMQKKEELTMEQLGSHLYVEEGIRLKESKNKGGAKTDDSWWVDIGATKHVCKDINLYKIIKVWKMVQACTWEMIPW
nr:uncharacterized protein LOC109188561 [Ipomoea batatas]